MKTFQSYLLLIALLTFAACGGDKKDESSQKSTAATEQPANVEDAMKLAQEAMEKANIKQTVEPVNFRKLQEFMPDKVAGFDREKLSGETAGAMNMKISRAEGRYKDGSGQNLKLEIVDTGGLTMGMMGMAAWASLTIDKEDDNGYERTGTLDGYKSYEKYRNDGSNNEISVLAEGRFVVNASCKGCSMETLKGVLKGADLGRLKGVK